MDVRLPSGIVLRGIPDGTPKEAIKAKAIKAGLASATDFGDAGYDPTEGMSGLEKFVAGIGQGAHSQYQGTGQLLGLIGQDEVRATRDQDAALLASGWGKAGSFLGKMAAPIVAAMTVPAASTVAGGAAIGGMLGLAEPVAEGNVAQGKALSGLLGAAGGAAGQKVGNLIGGKVADHAAKRAAEAQARAVANATKDATTQTGIGLGYVVPPTHANPTMTNRLLEGLAGKLTTGQAAAEKNQAVTDAVAKRVLGIADDQPLTVGAVESVRKSAGQAYESLKGFAQPFKADTQYIDDLAKISGETGALSREIPELASKDVDEFIGAFARQDFAPPVAVEAIKKLRANAKSLFKSDDPQKVAMARASRQIADSIEGLIERNLAASGDDALLASFKQARELIAKSYTIEDAINEGTGHVIARKLASQLAAGKPLSGELKDAAKFAQAYPKATQEVTSSMPGISPLDYYGSGAAAVASGNPLPLLFPAARMGARSGLLSPAYQKAMTKPNYSAGELEGLLSGLLSKSGGLAGMSTPLIYGNQ